MASKKQYTAEFKAKVALEALGQSQKDLQGLAQKYDVPVSAILTWVTQLKNKSSGIFEETTEEEFETSDQPFTDQEEVDVEISDPEIASSFRYGVMEDRLNYRRLAFWCTLGVVLIVIFVRALVELFQYNTEMNHAGVSATNEYYQVNQQKKEAFETLNSFGVVNLEEGIYRIPLDSAINEIAAGEE